MDEISWKTVFVVVVVTAGWCFAVLRVTGCAEKIGTSNTACIENPQAAGCPRAGR